MRMYIDDESPLGIFLLQHAPGRARTCALYDLYSRVILLDRQRDMIEEVVAKLGQIDSKLSGLRVVSGEGLGQSEAESPRQGGMGDQQNQNAEAGAKMLKMLADFDATLQ